MRQEQEALAPPPGSVMPPAIRGQLTAPLLGALTAPEINRGHSEPQALQHSAPTARVTRRLLCSEVAWHLLLRDEDGNATDQPPNNLQLPLDTLPSAAVCEVPLQMSLRELGQVQFLCQLPHVAALLSYSQHPSEPRSCLLHALPPLGTLTACLTTRQHEMLWQARLSVAHCTVQALAALHALGEVHGSVTTDHIGVCEDGSAWLLGVGAQLRCYRYQQQGHATTNRRRVQDVRCFGRVLLQLVDGTSLQEAVDAVELHWPPSVFQSVQQLSTECLRGELSMHGVMLRMSHLLSCSRTAATEQGMHEPLPPLASRWARVPSAALAPAALRSEEQVVCCMCLECFEEADGGRGLLCTAAVHGPALTCSECLNRWVLTLAAELRQHGGALQCQACCIAAQDGGGVAAMFGREELQPRLHGESLRHYLNSVELSESAELGAAADSCHEAQNKPEYQDAAHAADTAGVFKAVAEVLNVVCPRCGVAQDQDPDGCVAMTCLHCREAYCWLCFELCGSDAHPHVHMAHGDFFPPQYVKASWHKRWRWRRVCCILSQHSSQSGVKRQLALSQCRPLLEDAEVGLWPFPSSEPEVLHHYSRSDLISGAMDGDLERVRAALLEEECEVDEQNELQMTALMYASYHGHVPVVALLLQHGADPQLPDRHGTSALLYACREGQLQALQLLLAKCQQLDMAQVDRDGYTALMSAAENGHVVVVECLLQVKAVDVNFRCSEQHLTALMVAAQHGQAGVVEALLQHPHLDVNLMRKPRTSHAHDRPYTALMWAVGWQSMDVVRLLLSHPWCDVNAASDLGWTALFEAVHMGCSDCVELLLQHEEMLCDTTSPIPARAKVCARTPLMNAARAGHTRIVQLLLQHGADVNVTVPRGTAFVMAAEAGRTAVMQQLLVHPALDQSLQPDIASLVQSKLLTAQGLHLLLQHKGVNANMRQSPNANSRSQIVRGDTPLIWAVRAQDLQKLDVLLQHEAVDVNARSFASDTALIIAARRGSQQMVQMLLDRQDVDTSVMDGDGSTALVWAACGGHDSIVFLLLCHEGVNEQDLAVLSDRHHVTDWASLMQEAGRGLEHVLEWLCIHSQVKIASTLQGPRLQTSDAHPEPSQEEMRWRWKGNMAAQSQKLAAKADRLARSGGNAANVSSMSNAATKARWREARLADRGRSGGHHSKPGKSHLPDD